MKFTSTLYVLKVVNMNECCILSKNFVHILIWSYDFVFQLIFAKSFLLFLTQFAFFPDIVFSFIFYVYSKFYYFLFPLFVVPFCSLHSFCMNSVYILIPFSVVKLYNINFYAQYLDSHFHEIHFHYFSKIINCGYPECCAHHSYVVLNNLLCKSLSILEFHINCFILLIVFIKQNTYLLHHNILITTFCICPLILIFALFLILV